MFAWRRLLEEHLSIRELMKISNEHHEDDSEIGSNEVTSAAESFSKIGTKIGTTSLHWFGRGVAGGVMLIAAINALSYFFRTRSISDLIGKDQNVTESVGFPFEIWEEDKIYYGSMFVDYGGMAFNLLVGVLLGSLFGLIGVLLKSQFNRWVEDFEQNQRESKPLNLQFSVKSLLVMTTLAAVLIAIMTHWHGTPQVLIAIYFFGPISLVSIAMAPNRMRWQHRIVILTIIAFTMIGIALSSGIALGVSPDRVLLGIFVSWTPQSAFAAFFLLIGLIAKIWIGETRVVAT